MEQLGEELKRAREAAGLSLSEMATRTKIAATALESLERNDFSRLPGGIFGRSFVRSYATEVGVDPDATVARFIEGLKQSEREEAERLAARRPEITRDDRQFLERQRRALVALQVAIVVGVIAIISLVTWRVRVMLAEPDVPATVAEPAPVIVPPEPADPIPAPSAAADLNAPLVIELDLIGDCWMSIGVDGVAPVARLYRAGEHQRVEVTREVLLDIGNAGALKVAIDGRPAHSLGGDGVRVRTRITRENVAEFLE